MSELQTTKITNRAGTGSPNFSQGLKISGTDSGLLAPTRTEGETQPDAETSSNGDTFYDTVNETYDILIEGAWVRLLGAGGGAASWTVDLSNVTYDNVSFSVTSQQTNATALSFNTDGTKMYVGGNTTPAAINQYSLSTAFDLSTASYDSVSFTSAAIQELYFSADGTKLFWTNTTTVFQNSLSTAFDLSTASYDNVSFSVSSQESVVRALAFNDDGTKMYVAGSGNDTVYQYTMSTAYDLSTASYDSVSFSVSSVGIPYGIRFNTDGTKMYIQGSTNDNIYQYSLSTGFDLSTASSDGTTFTVTQGSTIESLHFSTDGTKMYALDAASDAVFQYSTGL